MRFFPELGRLGVGPLIKDHLATLYELDSNGSRRRSWSDIWIFFGGPTLIAIAALWWDVKIRGIAEVIGGMAILTALLFGLLVHVFTLGLRLSDDPRYTSSSRVTILIDELRANVAYACGNSLLLTVMLVCVAALAKNTPNGVNVPTSAISAWLFTHLALTLLMVINRVRVAYRLMAI